MAIVQISRIQIRRGLNQDLPQLASAEMGWSVDTQQLYIGNGTHEEGAPTTGVTEILTEYSILAFTASINANIAAVNSNITAVQSTVSTLQSEVGINTTANLSASSSGLLQGIYSNSSVVSYTLIQNQSLVRSGAVRFSRVGSTVTYLDDYTETSTSDITLSITANSAAASLNYSTTSPTTITYRIYNP